jgi:hypothetical protein
VTSRENYSLRRNVLCVVSSAYPPVRVTNTKYRLLSQKQKVQGIRGGRVDSSKIK